MKLPERKKLHSLIPALTAIAAIVVITIVLFLPPYIGMEDNGDFQRVTYSQGLYDLPENSELLYNGYYIKEYGIMQYFNEHGTNVYSSQFLFVQPAIWLDKLFTGNDEIFDLRFLAVVLTIYFAVVLYFFVDYLTYRLSLLNSLIMAAVCVYIFADTGYTAYFSSFYAEPVAYVTLIGSITCLLLYDDERYNPYILLAAFLINGLILTFSKQQFAPVGILLGLLGFVFIKRKRGWVFKSAVVTSSAALMVLGVVTYLLISSSFTTISMYHTMTRGVMMLSDNPAEAVSSFGIDDQYELLDGTIYFDKYPEINPENELLKEEFYPHYTVLSVAKYYLQNPGDYIDMLKIAARVAYQIRPIQGNYEYSEGHEPNAQTSIFALHSTLKSEYAPKTLGFIIIWIALMLALLYKKRRKQIILFGLVIVGLSQIVVSTIGAGDTDLAKHLFLYNEAFDMVNVVLLANILLFIDEKRRARKKPQTAEELNAEHQIEEAVYKNT